MMRLQPQIEYLALPHAQHNEFSNGGKMGLGNPIKYIHVLARCYMMSPRVHT